MEEGIDFKTKFFNLEGVHYNERKKNFYKLLSSTDPHTLAQLDLQPRNYLEKIFYVDILIHGKQVDKLLDILIKDGKGILSSKILKQKWFFEEAFKNMSEDTIVNDFLPTLSYSLRMKVLKKLSLSMNEGRMDNMFELLIQKYGLYIAQQFLFSCSSTKIITVLRNNKITLSVEQLKRILDRDSILIKVYFEEYQKNTGIYFDDYDFMSYAAWKYPNLYFELVSYFRGSVKVGYRTTISVLKNNMEEVLKDVNEIQRRFNIAAVTREVKDFDKEYLYKLFPDDKSRFQHFSIRASLLGFLKKYPLKNRWDIFSSAFKKAYNDDPTNHLELFDEQIVTMFPIELKQKWAEVKFKEADSLDYVRYFEPKKAFILLKDRLNVTSEIRKRTEMLKYLVRNCHANKDYNAYEAALEYICYRHRNDDRSLRTDLLHEISNNIDYELSTETLWKYINELVDLTRVKGEPLPFKNICQYVIFAFKKKLLSLSDTVAQFVKDCAGEKYFNWNLGYFDKEPNIKAELFKHMMIFLHTINPESKKRTIVVSFMGELVNFNKNHKNLWIDLNESLEIIGYLKELLLKQEYDKDDILSIEYLIKNNYGKNAQRPLKVFNDEQLLDMVKKVNLQMPEAYFGCRLPDALLDATKGPRRDEFQNRLLEYYFTQYLPEHCHYFGKMAAIQYFLTKEPAVLAKYFDHILPIESVNSMLDSSIIKLYSHLALDEKLINHFKPLVSATSTCGSKTKLIVSLSKIMPADDFIKLIAEYVPKKFKLDLTDSEQKSLYEAQCMLANALTNVNEVKKVIPLLYPFCQGDYLQSSLPVLYKVLYRVSEERAVSFINVLVERAASARKHAVYLSFELLPQKPALALFNIIATKESNLSAKKYLFKGILQYFLKNPSKIILDMVLTNLTFVDKNDQELLETLTKHTIQKCLGEFRPAFVEHLWNFLGILEKEEVKVVVYRCSLLGTLNAFDVTFFLSLRDTFCQRIIEDYFLSNDDALLRGGQMYQFVAKYLLAHNDDQHFKFVFNMIQNYRDLHWKSNNNEKLKYLFEFFECVYNGFIHEDVEYLILFKSHWERVFTHEECFFEYVVLRLMVLYIKDKGSSNISEFTKNVSKCFKELILVYGAYINDILLESIKEFLVNQRVLTDYTFSEYHFALQLLEFDSSEINCFLAASIVADCTIDEHKEINSKVIETLKSVNNFTARIRYNCLLKNKWPVQ